MSLRFDEPLWLLAGVVSLPLAIIGWRWFTSMSRPRRFTAVAARFILVWLIVGMLAGASLRRETSTLAVVAVVDVSGSVDRYADLGLDSQGRSLRSGDAASAFLQAAAASQGPDDLFGLVVFDGRATAMISPRRRSAAASLPVIEAGRVEGTDIEQALRLAAGMLPPDATGRLVLISDGVQTSGDALSAARLLAGASHGSNAPTDGDSAKHIADETGRAGVTVDVVPIPTTVKQEVVVESVDSPPIAPAGASVTVRVVLAATGPSTGTLRLLREGEPLDINGPAPGTGRAIALHAGRTVELITVPLERGRIHRFAAVFEPDPVLDADGKSAGYNGDTVLTNNRGESFTATPGRGSVLIVDGVSGANPEGVGQTLPNAFRAAGVDVQVIGPEAVQADLLWLQGFDLVMLQNVPAESMPRPVHSALAAYVTELGGGLVMIGGRDSFGAGGWKGTVIEPLLPVKLDLPEKLVVPAAAVVIVLDCSGSMNATVMGMSRTQQEIANEGAALAVESMDKTDLVGVVSFNNQFKVQRRLAPNSDPKSTAAIIRAISADGGTMIGPALREAERQLRDAKADVKHVVLLTDGRSQNDDELPELARQMGVAGIKVSTIGLGDKVDTDSLSAIAHESGGRYYRVIDPTVLPRIFVKAVRVIRTPMIREAPFEPVVLGTMSPLVDGMPDPAPTLRGMVLTQPREEPTVVYAMAAPTGEPLLAHWNAGLGRVGAFTSDAHEWAGEWLAWPGYSRMWMQIVRTLARPPTDRSQELGVQIVGDRLMVTLDATEAGGGGSDGTGEGSRPLDMLNVPVSVYLPESAGMSEGAGADGGTRRVDMRLSQTGPGHYEGSLPAPTSGNYVVVATPRLGTRALPAVIGGASRTSGIEYRRLGGDAELLNEIARTTGGRVLSFADGAAAAGARAGLFDRSGVRPTVARVPIWRSLLLWTVLVMLLDVATRRIAWDRVLSREFGAALAREAAAAQKDRGAQAAKAADRLRERSVRAATTVGAAVNTTGERVREQRPAALGEDAARDIIKQSAERRRAERAAAVSGGDVAGVRTAKAGPLAGNPEAQPSSETPVARKPGARKRPPTPESAPVDPEQRSAGLMDAKKRAREKMDEGKEGKG